MRLYRAFVSIVLSFILITPTVVLASYEGGIPKEWDIKDVTMAQITLGNTIVGDKIELIDGGEADFGVVTANKHTKYGGRECREVYVANKLSFKVDDSFFAEGDNLFLFEFEYWDYSGAGMFYLDYANEEALGSSTRVNVYKRGIPGTPPKWRTEAVLVSGVDFNHSLEFGADFQIANRANNAFASIKIYNLSPIANRLADIDCGVYNEKAAKILYDLGLYQAENASEIPKTLSKTLTREAAIQSVLKCLGLEKKALESKLPCPYTDVAKEYVPYVALAKSMGMIDNNTTALGAQQPLSQRELISYYLCYFEAGTTDDKVEKTAKEHRLIRGANYIFQMDKNATYDNLAALSYNSLKKVEPKTGELMVLTLLKQNAVTLAGIIKCGDKEFYGKVFEKPVYCEPVEVTDNMSGRKWRYLDFFGASIMRSYFTQQSWTADNERFIFSDENKFIYVYNTKTYMIRKIGEYFASSDFTLMTMAPKSNNFYFVNPKKQIIKMDMDTYEETVVVQLPDGIYLATDLGVSDNEKVISLNCYIHVDGIPVDTRVAWYDVEKDELNLNVWRDFTEIDGAGYYSMHVNVNPVYTDLLLYCAGGSYTGPAPFRSFTRVWLHNTKTGDDFNFFKEYRMGYSPAGMNFGEQNCHETWTCDGEYLVINKAGSSPNALPTHIGYSGIVLLNKNGRDRRYVGCPTLTVGNTTYEMYLTHPGVSSVDPRWVVADQTFNFAYNMNHWPIYLIDVDSGKWQLIANPPHNGTSSFHPHPSTSHDGNTVIFGTTSETGKGRIGWMDISDLVSVPQNGQRVWLSDSCEALDYAEFEYDLQPEQNLGEQAYRIKNGKKLYLNVNNDVVWGVKQDVTLSITYLDAGVMPLKLEYYVWMDKLLTNKLDNRVMYLNRTNTNKWKTIDVTLRGVNLDNMELLATDMKLSGVGSDAVIKEITAKKAE